MQKWRRYYCNLLRLAQMSLVIAHYHMVRQTYNVFASENRHTRREGRNNVGVQYKLILNQP